MEHEIDLTDLPSFAPTRRARRRVRAIAQGTGASAVGDCIDLSFEEDPGAQQLASASLKAGLVASGVMEQQQRQQQQWRRRNNKRQWADMTGREDLAFDGSSPGPFFACGGPSARPAGSSEGSGESDALHWGATGARQRRRRAAPGSAHQEVAADDDPEVAIMSVVAPTPAPSAQPAPARAGRPGRQAAPAPAPTAARRRASPGRREQEEEDARLARQLAQEDEVRRKRADDYARARMQMWQDLEEASMQRQQQQQRPTRSRGQQQQQQQPSQPQWRQQPRPRSGGAQRRGSGGGGGAEGAAMPYSPMSFLPPGRPPHVLFGAGIGSGGSAGRRSSGGYGQGRGGVPQPLMALREAVVGLQRSGLPPHLLFSDRDFTADDYDLLCRLDDTVDSRKGASKEQLSQLPTQTAPAGGLTGEGGERLACSVCLEEFGDGQQLCTLPCLHKFHAGCIQTWLRQKATCPVCQQKL
ncbi:hypothetical protein MNEG_8552 [Monoraphidium neglectum]|uniref:RING-type domain-containing protein n=1 Tax=Monoraphidium neglectum TaxID=145388 RepID=A0A0D2M7R6_9CHLO|nr:hypothetical protein MNEG_8552 [Monoraphidium neglectum]KIY99409.1 hypothetical protein MNEG_8552 [Monoraphidium neglectum]|eukprot:XP_013898429.1 hypothetical protein MNEG_8552 [Monoraphidium neglectum]